MKFMGIASEQRTSPANDIICLVIYDGLLSSETMFPPQLKRLPDLT